jgi:SRSO17 transposase
VGRRPQAAQSTGVPEDIGFQTKSEIAVEQIRTAVDRGIPQAPVLADAAYGNDSKFREAIRKLDLQYVVGVQSSMSVWKAGTGPLPKPAWKGKGRPPRLLRRDRKHAPLSARQLAFSLPAQAWKTVTWREGSRHPLRSRFAAVRVRPAHRDYERSQPHAEEWLLMEWPGAEAEPTKYWLSTLSAKTQLRDLVRLAKQRWIIERDYQELKQELGLGHYEGRGWRGFHHHATLCIAAYGFLLAEPIRSPNTPALPSSGLVPCARSGITLGPLLLYVRPWPGF